MRAAVAAANAANPDLVVLTGDYVCWRRHEAPMVADQLAGLTASRVLAVLGNHDYFTWGAGVAQRARAQRLRGAARTSTTVAQVRGAPLAMVGVDDPVTRHDDLDAAFAGAPVGADEGRAVPRARSRARSSRRAAPTSCSSATRTAARSTCAASPIA